ncbi:hypothetical protein ACE6H2_020417 [Prunus campanulata]
MVEQKKPDGALIFTESLFNGTEDLVKLDLSYCGVTFIYVLKLSTDSSMICGILELNLSGNPIMQEELNLADNANLSISESSPAVSVSEEVNPAQQGSATRLELGDSEDEEVKVEAAASGVDDNCKVQRYCILHGQDQDMVQLGSISRTRQSICS